MMRNLCRHKWVLALMALLMAGMAQAQLKITITEGNAGALPVVVVPFTFEGVGNPPDTDVSAVITADLNRSGQFRVLEDRDVIERPTRGSEIKFGTWKQLRQDYIVVGRVRDSEDGGYRIEFELYNVNTEARMMGLAVNGRPAAMRSTSHQVADFIYEKILGVRGAFDTRIAYVTANRLPDGLQYALMVADADGFNPQTVVRSREPLLSPAWSPDGRRLAYVSFERGNSAILIQELATGSRKVLASFKGINGAPAFSPDGTRLALTLSRSGNPEIVILDLASNQFTQLTRHWSIDTEPQWTPDGRKVLFTSDRSGKPQIYEVAATGGEPTRVTFDGEYNARASIAFDGKRIAVAQGNGNVYRIAVLDREFDENRVLSPGNLDESPSFAPNGSMILYASREGAKGVLAAVSADGRVRQRLVLADGDVREPAWGPYRQR